MQAHQLFQKMSPTLGQSIINWMRTDEKEVYKAAVSTLAQQRKLRPVYITQKSRDQQTAFLLDSLKMKLTEGVGENVLQVWLMKGRSSMLASFLDSLEITHDGKGGVEGDLPKELDADKVAAGVKKLLESHPAEEVAIYLHLFQLQQPGGWKEIADALQADGLPLKA
jgi:hypothetical protein